MSKVCSIFHNAVFPLWLYVCFYTAVRLQLQLWLLQDDDVSGDFLVVFPCFAAKIFRTGAESIAISGFMAPGLVVFTFGGRFVLEDNLDWL